MRGYPPDIVHDSNLASTSMESMQSPRDPASDEELMLFPDEALVVDTIRLLRVARVGQAHGKEAAARVKAVDDAAEKARTDRLRRQTSSVSNASVLRSVADGAGEHTADNGQTAEEELDPANLSTIGTEVLDRLTLEAMSYVVPLVWLDNPRVVGSSWLVLQLRQRS